MPAAIQPALPAVAESTIRVVPEECKRDGKSVIVTVEEPDIVDVHGHKAGQAALAYAEQEHRLVRACLLGIKGNHRWVGLEGQDLSHADLQKLPKTQRRVRISYEVRDGI